MSEPTRDPHPAAVAFCAVVVAAVLVLVVCSDPPRAPGTAAAWPAQLSPSAARAALDRLGEVEPAFEVGYERSRDFGPAWADLDGNGCDTRNDVLARDLESVRRAADGCVVLSGILVDPYTGATVPFDRSDATAVQIDHLVPLHAAWTLGAWSWSGTRRAAFANDPRNLVAVSGAANQDKGDRLADRWRPPNEKVRCVYAIDTVAVHDAYELAATGPERRALRQMLGTCP